MTPFDLRPVGTDRSDLEQVIKHLAARGGHQRHDSALAEPMPPLTASRAGSGFTILLRYMLSPKPSMNHTRTLIPSNRARFRLVRSRSARTIPFDQSSSKFFVKPTRPASAPKHTSGSRSPAATTRHPSISSSSPLHTVSASRTAYFWCMGFRIPQVSRCEDSQRRDGSTSSSRADGAGIRYHLQRRRSHCGRRRPTPATFSITPGTIATVSSARSKSYCAESSIFCTPFQELPRPHAPRRPASRHRPSALRTVQSSDAVERVVVETRLRVSGRARDDSPLISHGVVDAAAVRITKTIMFLGDLREAASPPQHFSRLGSRRRRTLRPYRSGLAPPPSPETSQRRSRSRASRLKSRKAPTHRRHVSRFLPSASRCLPHTVGALDLQCLADWWERSSWRI